MRHLKRLGNQFQITILTDDAGYTGRECPECKSYFKIVFGTGIKDEVPCHCPYCGHVAEQSEFHTQAQIEYAQSVVMKQVMGAISRDFKDMARNFDRRCSGGLFSMSMDVKTSPTPLRYYREKELETHVECSNCTLKYAVYGVFGYCPDCGKHNSLQILDKNLEVVLKILAMVANAEGELKEKLIENALEDCVSAFDGFGREVCNVFASMSNDEKKGKKIRFQNLEGAKKNIIDCFGIDLSAAVSGNEWKQGIRGFQKRHLLAHKMGVVDEDYILKTGDGSACVGRKISITESDVHMTLEVIRKIANYLTTELERIRIERQET